MNRIENVQEGYDIGYGNPATPARQFTFGHLVVANAFRSGQLDRQNHQPRNLGYREQDYDPETLERKLPPLTGAAPVSDGWFVLTRCNNGSDVRARHATGGSTWVAECRTNADAAHIATFSPERVLALLAVCRAAKEADACLLNIAPPDAFGRLRRALAAFDALQQDKP